MVVGSADCCCWARRAEVARGRRGAKPGRTRGKAAGGAECPLCYVSSPKLVWSSCRRKEKRLVAQWGSTGEPAMHGRSVSCAVKKACVCGVGRSAAQRPWELDCSMCLHRRRLAQCRARDNRRGTCFAQRERPCPCGSGTNSAWRPERSAPRKRMQRRPWRPCMRLHQAAKAPATCSRYASRERPAQ